MANSDLREGRRAENTTDLQDQVLLHATAVSGSKMKKFTGTHSKTYILIVLMVLFGPLGNVLLGKGMRQIGPITSWNPAGIGRVLELALRSPTLWLGIVSLITFTVAYMLVLSRADYSFVLPASSIAYGMVALMGHFLLGETVTPVRWAGVLIICAGVLVVGHTPPNTTEGG
jgi:drug/metabolite transporter (DMT)-like permease